MKIIIVDDEMSALHTFLSDVIGKTDTEYRFFNDNERDITEYVSKNDVSAAFLDISMPNISGVDLAKKLLSLNPELRIVFITGLSITTDDLDETIRKHTAGILYKPYDADELRRLISTLERGVQKLTVRMFGSFDCFVGNSPVRFSSQKSKELFALLLAYNGKSLTMPDAISQLWPDIDTAKSKVLYRDAVWRLRKALGEINFNCVEFRRACLFLNKENIECDFWDFLNGNKTGYAGEFCKNYDWSIYYLPILDS